MLSDSERGIILEATHTLKDHLHHGAKNTAAGRARSKFTLKELLSEAEDVLLRSSGGI